jgi:uroporphyrinogen decarboxylase
VNGFRRMQSALEGGSHDQIPVSAWYHFGSEHLAPPDVAKLHADYQAAYDWDFLKVMFDYRLDYPEAVDGSADFDLSLMLQETDWAAPFRRQREVLQLLLGELGSTAPVVETVYSPWMYLVRHIGRDAVERARETPDLLARILERLTEETCRHVKAVRQLGGYGIYFATLAACRSEIATAAEFTKPYDLEVLDVASGLVRMLHLHGPDVDATSVRAYRRDIIHWEDRDAGNPSLSELRADNRCLMGGLSSSALTGLSLHALRRQAREAISEAGGNGFVLAPGCSVSPSLSFRKMRALRDHSLLAP